MAMEKTSSRVAMALMCGLAICCAIMYITADGADVPETVLAQNANVYGIGGPTSVDSEDVEKSGTVITNTPDGRMRLSDYLTNVEKEISAEEAARKRDVAAVREQMARNYAFNKEARSKLQKEMLAKMAVNAKKAKDDLNAAMAFVQAKFAEAAKLQNARKIHNEKRSAELRKRIAADKAEATRNLQTRVLAQQRAMATLTEQTNARITQTNKHVSANAALIKENAKKARQELDKAVSMFDTKVANARKDAQAGRSKLATQLEEQDKSIRQWANNKLKVVMAETAAQFKRVRDKMAKDREAADNALKVASTRMTAALNANAALNDENFETTVKDIKAAKAEAKAKVDAANKEFKVGLFKLSAVINEQVKKSGARIDQLTNTVENHKVAQAKVNSNVAAEIKRMIKIGDKRYEEHLKKDKELEALIKSNKEATDKRIKTMGLHYMAEIDTVRATMKKNRAHATHMLAKATGKLYAAIAKSEEEQLKTNNDLRKESRRTRLDIADALTEAKNDFGERIGALHKTVVDNDKKFEKKIDDLTGIVREDAVKNAKGRQQLSDLMGANKKELMAAVSSAIHKGETRMGKAETHLMKLSKKTKAALNLRITTQISKLSKEANSQIENLRLNSKEARAEMKKELLLAIRSMAKEAKENLDDAVKVQKKKFFDVNALEAAAYKKSAADRAKIADEIKTERKSAKRQLDDAVATMQRALLALKTETEKKVKDTNTRVDAYAKAITKEAGDVSDLMKAQLNQLTTGINNQAKAASAATKAANKASAEGFKNVAKEVTDALDGAAKRSNAKFKTMYEKMAKQRGDLDKNLGTAVNEINDSIAKQAALADSRFSKTVKDIEAARKQASEQVKQARKDFATSLATVTSSIKDMETKLTGEVQVISGEVISHKAQQLIVNRKTSAELKRIQKLMNDQASKSVKARGKLRNILDENKRAAAEEVKALSNLFTTKIGKIRSQAAANAREAKRDLTKATEKMYEKMAAAQKAQLYANENSNKAIGAYSAEALAAIATERKSFNARLTTLTNTVAANHKTVEEGFQVLTGVIRNYKTAGEEDRKLIREQNDAMNNDMNKAIVRAIQIGEARATGIAQRARENLAGFKKAMLIEVTNTVEDYADMTFKTIQGNHGKVADNYLSLKAYAITASSKLAEYVEKGKGKNLSSLGDLLVNIAALSNVKPTLSEGISPSKKMSSVFSGKVKVKNSVNKINNLVNEFVTVSNACRQRWPDGLGKYLILKVEESMSKKGVLQVDKIDGKNGNWVFMNGQGVGLSNKLEDFEHLAVRMRHYESSLAKLTSRLSGKKQKNAKIFNAKPPEWQGN